MPTVSSATRLAVLFSLLALLASPLATAQPAPDATYWIVVDATTDAPPPTDRALARRALRGTGAPVDRTLTPDAREALEQLGVEIRVESRWLGAVSASLSDRQRDAVVALPFVREVRRMGRMIQADVALAQPMLMLDYGPSAGQLALVRADEVIEAGYTGVGVRVGFLDTVFDFTHPAVSDVASDGRLLGTRDFTPGAQSSTHGLSVSSVTLGHDEGSLVGPAFGAEVLAATTEYAPTETHAEEDALVAGLEWLEANGVDVVNISLGYTTFDPGEGDYTPADLDGNTTIVTRAVDRAAARGVIVVTSAGNEGNSSWGFISAPADADSVIVVGAVDSNGTYASFSSFGPTADGRTKPDVVAQGVAVRVAQPNGGYGTSNGTSFSAPMVTGVVAPLLQADPTLTPIQMRTLLRSTASQANNPDNRLGWGIVDAFSALGAIPTAGATGPTATEWRLYPSTVRPGGQIIVESPRVSGLEIFDLTGRRVARLGAGAGRRSVEIPALPGGVYLVRPVSESPLPALRLAVVR